MESLMPSGAFSLNGNGQFLARDQAIANTRNYKGSISAFEFLEIYAPRHTNRCDSILKLHDLQHVLNRCPRKLHNQHPQPNLQRQRQRRSMSFSLQHFCKRATIQQRPFGQPQQSWISIKDHLPSSESLLSPKQQIR
jgi:hypothetical protein